MSDSRTTNPARLRRITAIAICALFLLALLLSTLFVFVERHHHCTGDHCVICAAVSRTMTYLKAEAGVSLIAVALVGTLYAMFLLVAIPATPDAQTHSLVALKVKLSD